MILRPILQPILQPVLRSPFDRRPTALTISQLLPAGAGRVAAIYTDPARPSYDECIQKNMDAMGPELVVNGGFDSESGWTLDPSASITGGKLNVGTRVAGEIAYRTDAAIVPGRAYCVSFTLNVISGSNNVSARIGGSVGGIVNTSGRHTEVIVAGSTGTIALQGRSTGTTNCTIDDFSVREIDLSKCVLFSDAAGQTPVVYPIGAGQGKGLLLDRSAGLVRGPENLDGTWTLPATWTQDGTDLLSNNTTNALAVAGLAVPLDPYSWYEVQFNIKEYTSGTVRARLRGGTTSASPNLSGVGLRKFLLYSDTNTIFDLEPSFSIGFVGRIGDISVKKIPGHHQQQPTAAARGEFSRRYNLLTATDTLVTQSITAIATQYRLYFTGAGTVTLSGAATGTYSAGSHTITCTAGSLTLTVAGEVLTADLRFEADATIGLPEYQRVTTASDYDEVGFPTYWRAQTDDWAQSHMNPNGATKAYVFWAGQIMSEAAAGILAETSVDSSSVNGTMRMTAPRGNGTNQRSFFSRGTLNADAVYVAGAPIAPSRSVFVGNASIPDAVCLLHVNGISVGSSTTSQGTGTYTEQDVFFASRAGTSLFANIREYAPPMILFLQPADSLSASHLAKLQKGYAKAVGVTL